jgi:hypothetical protein
MRKYTLTLFVVLGMVSLSAQAGIVGAKQFADQYTAHVKRTDPSYKLTANAGRDFYVKKYTRKGKEESCSSCHMDNPANEGKHSETGKPIRPLSPVVNPKRFSNLQHVEENFTKHCHDIIGRDCTPKEKGDYIIYLLTVQNPESTRADMKK